MDLYLPLLTKNSFLALEMQEYLDPDVWHLGVIAEEGAEK